jgi:23S rRNA (pseudouridine1915-N3)-methyltransferase
LRRLQGRLDFQIRELTPALATNPAQQRRREGEEILRAAGGAMLIALDERGSAWSTVDLAERLARWQIEHRLVTLAIGGAEGLADEVKAAAAQTWSLSRLTLPHQLARVIVIEQVYRAWSLLNHHPYHRA